MAIRSTLRALEDTFLAYLQSSDIQLDKFSYYSSMQAIEGEGMKPPFIAVMSDTSVPTSFNGNEYGPEESITNRTTHIRISINTGGAPVVDSSQTQMTVREYHDSCIGVILNAFNRTDIVSVLNEYAPEPFQIDQFFQPREKISVSGNGFVTELEMDLPVHWN